MRVTSGLMFQDPRPYLAILTALLIASLCLGSILAKFEMPLRAIWLTALLGGAFGVTLWLLDRVNLGEVLYLSVSAAGAAVLGTLLVQALGMRQKTSSREVVDLAEKAEHSLAQIANLKLSALDPASLKLLAEAGQYLRGAAALARVSARLTSQGKTYQEWVRLEEARQAFDSCASTIITSNAIRAIELHDPMNKQILVLYASQARDHLQLVGDALAGLAARLSDLRNQSSLWVAVAALVAAIIVGTFQGVRQCVR